jgi:LemA protein
MAFFLIFIAIVVVVGFYFVSIYNSLVGLRNRVKNAWSQIDVQLKRRHDLIPNLIETVKGYMKHEKSLFTDIAKFRAEMLKAGSVEAKAKSNNQITDALKTVFALSEDECG